MILRGTLLFLCLLLGGCGEGGGVDTATTGSAAPSAATGSTQETLQLGTFSALLGEEHFLTTSGKGEFDLEYGMLTLSASGETEAGTSASLLLRISGVRQPGTFPLGGDSGNHAGITLGTALFNTLLGGSGTLTITSLSIDIVAGTFTFTAGDGLGGELSVTEGLFRVPTTPL